MSQRHHTPSALTTSSAPSAPTAPTESAAPPAAEPSWRQAALRRTVFGLAEAAGPVLVTVIKWITRTH